MQIREKKYHYFLVIAACILSLLPLFLIFFCVRPFADDFDYALLTHAVVENKGSVFSLLGAAWTTIVNFYNGWQGTYSSAFVMSLQPGIWGIEYYTLTPFLIFGFSFFCIFVAVAHINKWFIHKTPLYSFTVSLLILTILYLWLPSPTQGLFWYNGAMHYVPWFFASLLNIILLLESGFSSSNRRRFSLLAICSILSFIISGGNQVTAFANILLMLALLLFHPAHRRRDVLIPLLFAVIGFAIMFVAPGNSVRQSGFERNSVLGTMIHTLYHTIPQFSQWLSFNWLLSLIILTPVVLDIAFKNQFSVSGWKLLLVFLISFAVLCGMFCVIYMPTGSFGEGRLTNVIWFAFMIFSWINYCFLVLYLHSHKYIFLKSLGHPAIWTVITVACLSVLFAGMDGDARSSSFTALRELRAGYAQQFAQEMDERYALLEDDSLKEAAIAPISVTHSMLYLIDLSTNPSDWPNTSMADYFHKDTIYVIAE